MTRTRIFALFAALATALFMSACSSQSADQAGDGHTGHSHDEETTVVSGEPADFNADDVSFARNMIPHHEQAVELSALVPDRSDNTELQALAKQISAAQDPEITTMKAFLVQWTGGEDSTEEHSGHDGHQDMAGMVDEATMTKLEDLKGTEFDTLWLQSMISHHQGAIDMAKAELANGTNTDAKSLAQGIIDTQQAEITQMQKMLGTP